MRFLLCGLVITCTVNAYSFAAETNEETNKKLHAVQAEITQQKLAINNVSKKRRSLEKQLEKDDIAIGKATKSIITSNKNIEETQSKISALEKDKIQLTIKKQKQEDLLANQLRSAYSNGHHDYIKLILNQEQPSKVQRTLTYYQYLNAARIEEIESFQQTLSQLLSVTTELQEKEDAFEKLKAEQLTQKIQYQQSKDDRQKTIKSLNSELLSNKQQLARLEAEENNLVSALAKLAAAAKAEIDLHGLDKLRRKLHWPVKGKITHRFGTRKRGYLKWKGVVLAAPAGRQIKSIHNGTILFNDWLKGYGLVTVIDHGNGYMSLYGHNQTLLKSVGDRVETGEPIALVGQSGGQLQTGLYFEVRHKGQAVNPKLWCR